MRICTHSGSFHADDVCAAAVLLRIHPKAGVMRSRKPEDWELADIVFDVGGEFSPMDGRFDHHQTGQELPVHEDGTPYSSFGMIWDTFGQDFLEVALEDYAISREQMDAIYDDFRERIVVPVDALDNGIVRESPIPRFLGAFNPDWWEDLEADFAFMDAADVAGQYLERQARRSYGRILAQNKAAAMERPMPGLVVLDTYFPWQDFVEDGDLFVIHPDEKGNTVLRTVPTERNGFTSRQPLPESWVEAYPDGAEFVHKNRFIAVFSSKASALAAAQSLV